jgi:hypothetical protein
MVEQFNVIVRVDLAKQTNSTLMQVNRRLALEDSQFIVTTATQES